MADPRKKLFDPNKPITTDDLELAAILQPYGAEEAGLEDQLEQAKGLRGVGAPEMRSAGKLKFAAHPLEFVGNAAQKVAGTYGVPSAIKGMGEMGGRMKTSMMDLLEERRRRKLAAGGFNPVDDPAVGGTGPNINITDDMEE